MAELPSGVTWTQDEDSIEVSIDVPHGGVRADLRVTTKSETLTVQHNSADGWKSIITGQLRHAVEQSSCCWALEKKRKSEGSVIVIQLEKQQPQEWDALLGASVKGSILEELGRDQVIVDAGASTAESVTCGRCGALVKSSRWEAHSTMWCDALANEEEDGGGGGGGGSGGGGRAGFGQGVSEEDAKKPADHLYWARSPTDPAGSVPPTEASRKLAETEPDGHLV